MFKPKAAAAVLDDTAVQLTTSRYQRVFNDSANVAVIQIGSNSSNVSVGSVYLGAGQSATLDCSSHNNWISLAVDETTVYRTPVSGDE
tara:strand:+ start:17224 stop:17487 length:264 start_codon:yes stop_codon:yes gene_type:complete